MFRGQLAEDVVMICGMAVRNMRIAQCNSHNVPFLFLPEYPFPSVPDVPFETRVALLRTEYSVLVHQNPQFPIPHLPSPLSPLLPPSSFLSYVIPCRVGGLGLDGFPPWGILPHPVSCSADP